MNLNRYGVPSVIKQSQWTRFALEISNYLISTWFPNSHSSFAYIIVKLIKRLPKFTINHKQTPGFKESRFKRNEQRRINTIQPPWLIINLCQNPFNCKFCAYNNYVLIFHPFNNQFRIFIISKISIFVKEAINFFFQCRKMVLVWKRYFLKLIEVYDDWVRKWSLAVVGGINFQWEISFLIKVMRIFAQSNGGWGSFQIELVFIDDFQSVLTFKKWD